ncbi:kinase-like protein [Pholiota conissans]|uniref:non-specific serine/threonine protein kinase n=1 Tax=Pholiota conissans TaxID=109636 RepID=A0A9P6D4P3_9AGAR|nr:kinase-like protein [Pholiota conissans]
MPVIRGQRRTRGSKGAHVGPMRHLGDEPQQFEVYTGEEYGWAFKPLYYSKNVPEFTTDPATGHVPIPKDCRPPALILKDLDCLRVLGEGYYDQVYLARVNRREHPLDIPAVFALKSLRRRDYRYPNISVLGYPPRGHFPANCIPGMDEETKLIVEEHYKMMNGEKCALVHLPWSPWVTGIYQAFHDEERLYMALEYIPGGTLRSVIADTWTKNGRLSVADAQFYFANIVLALEFLHGCELVHCDLKPENILVGGDGYLVLTDFGRAQWAENKISQWQGIGTLYYMAPECFPEVSPKPQDEPYAVDWWASGVILFEMLTSNLPFCGKTYEETRKAILFRRWQWPVNFKAGKNLNDVVSYLLAPHSSQRLGRHSARDVEKHAWLEAVEWDKMDRKGYLAPFIPSQQDITKLWHKLPLPKQHYVPGLKVIEPPIHLKNDDRFPCHTHG